MVKRSQVIVEALTGIKKVDLGVRLDPGALLIGLIMPYVRKQDNDVLKEPPVGAFQQIEDENCFSTSRLPEYRRRMSRLWPEVNKPLRRAGHLQYWVEHPWRQKIHVQSAGRLCLLRYLDRNAFTGVFHAAAAAMKAVIIACPEVKPQWVILPDWRLPAPGLLRPFLFRSDAYCWAQGTSCLLPHLTGAHPLTVELVGDALDGDHHFRYLGAVKGLCVASERLLHSKILEEHQNALHAAGGHV